MDTLCIDRNINYNPNQSNQMTPSATESTSSREIAINGLIQTSLKGKVHIFDETMNKEVIHKKMDDLFGW